MNISHFYWKAKCLFGAGEQHVLSLVLQLLLISLLLTLAVMLAGVAAVVVEMEGTTS